MNKRCMICSNPIMDEDACAKCDINIERKQIDDPIEFTYEIQRRVREDADNFIFETIEPYCSNIAQQKISKKDLEEAIQLWMAAKKIMHVEENDETN